MFEPQKGSDLLCIKKIRNLVLLLLHQVGQPRTAGRRGPRALKRGLELGKALLQGGGFPGAESGL